MDVRSSSSSPPRLCQYHDSWCTPPQRPPINEWVSSSDTDSDEHGMVSENLRARVHVYLEEVGTRCVVSSTGRVKMGSSVHELPTTVAHPGIDEV